MEFNEFLMVIVDMLPEYLMEYDVDSIRVDTVKKNNGVVLTAIVIMLKGESIVPNIYVDNYYTRYRQGELLDVIVRQIVEEYKDARNTIPMGEIMPSNASAVKKLVFMKLVNYEKNKEKLRDCPYIPFLDLAITFRILVSNENGHLLSGLIRNKEQEMWNMTTEELYQAAIINTKQEFPPSIKKLSEKIGEFVDNDYIPETNLYILSNTINLNGAIYMLDKNILEEFANMHNAGFYIIPSSIHEVLLLPDNIDKAIDKSQLLEIVNDVNEYVVSDTDYLSNKVYYYDICKKTIEF